MIEKSEKKIKTWINKQSSVILSAFISLTIVVITFAVNGIYWGSDKLILIFDMGSQYAPLYSYLHYLENGYNSIFYQTYSGFGGGFFGSFAYYLASPLSWLILAFDISRLPDALYLLTVLKISLCSLTFSLYLKYGHIKCNNTLLIVLASVSYSLMSYNLVYSICLMWLDGVILFPLIVLGADWMLKGKKNYLFVIMLSFAIVCNYYIAYMIILFLPLYVLRLVVSEGYKVKDIMRYAFTFLVSGVWSALLSAFIWLPVACDLLNANSHRKIDFLWLFRNPFGVIRGLFPHSYSGFLVSDYPNIYCGLLISIVFILHFFLQYIPPKKRISDLVVLIVFIISFSTEIFDRVWHAFNAPSMFPARYSFLFSFYLILVFSEEFIPLSEKISVLKSSWMMMLVTAFALIDLTYNSCYSISAVDNDPVTGHYVSRMVYDENYQDMLSASQLFSPGLYVADTDFTYNDGFMYGQNNPDYYLSSYKAGLIDFLSGLGLACEDRVMTFDYLTPLTGTLFGVNNVLLKDLDFDRSPNVYMLCEFMEEKIDVNGMYLFRNNNESVIGSVICNSDDVSFIDNVFENNNVFSYLLTGIDDVFSENKIEIVDSGVCNDGGLFYKNIIVYPEEDKHLLFYISSGNYYENNDLENYDVLYMNGERIALYENTGMESIVDLGRKDGTPIEFTYISDSVNNEVFFYTFNDDAYERAIDSYESRKINSSVISKKGIEFYFDSDSDVDMLLYIPYEKGYSIKIDGKDTSYESFLGGFIKLSVPKGQHQCMVIYHAPGLCAGIITSTVAVILLIYLYIKSNLHKRMISKYNK